MRALPVMGVCGVISSRAAARSIAAPFFMRKVFGKKEEPVREPYTEM